jgi:hypothetical protein
MVDTDPENRDVKFACLTAAGSCQIRLTSSRSPRVLVDGMTPPGQAIFKKRTEVRSGKIAFGKSSVLVQNLISSLSISPQRELAIKCSQLPAVAGQESQSQT